MKNITPLAFFILFIGCVNSNNVFWCGDHACANNKEKEEYFAKTMIVEIKQKNKKNKKILSKVEMIEKEYGLNQEEENKKKIENKKISKKTQNNRNKQLKREKEIEKQILLDEKKRLKQEKKILKENKKLSKKKRENKETISAKESITTKSNDFDDLAKSILEKNKTKSFPDINDIN